MKRRDFLGRLAVGAAALGASRAFPALGAGQTQTIPVPGADTLALRAVTRTIEVNGKAARVFGLTAGANSGLTVDAERTLDLSLSNEIGSPTLIHWHGLTPPWDQDGVPDNPASLLAAGAARRYALLTGRGGTQWMHAHTLQEQNLLAAPLIVRTEADRSRDEQEVVILLHDFSFTPAEEILTRLQRSTSSAHGAMSMPGMGGGITHAGMGSGMAGMMPGGGLAAAAMDLNDIEYDAYLANDRTLDDPEVVRIERGGRVRLRIINGATATAFTIQTGALTGDLVAVDGQEVQPVTGNAFPIAMGQRLDIRLQVPAGSAHPILALREGALERTGLILAAPGAVIAKVPIKGGTNGPVLDLALEGRLRPLAPLPSPAADRRVALTLAGTMEGYRWSIDGADGLRVRRGERIEVTLANATLLAHPMHLPGHHFQVGGIGGKAVGGAVRDTVLVPPMTSVTIAFDADNEGHWPLHCHHLYHMAAGMMAFVDYAS